MRLKNILTLAFMIIVTVSCSKANEDAEIPLPSETIKPLETPIVSEMAEASETPMDSEKLVDPGIKDDSENVKMIQPLTGLIDYSSDALLAVTKIERIHPIFVIEEQPENYEDVKAEYLEYTSQPLVKTDFLLATQKYLTVLKDGHMGIGLIKWETTFAIDWYCEDNKLYLLSEDGETTEQEVVKIGNIPTNEVMAKVNEYYFGENDTARQIIYENYCRIPEILELAGCELADNKIAVTINHKGAEEILEFQTIAIKSQIYNDYSYIIQHEMIEDVFYIDLRAFRLHESIDDTATAIEEAINQGTTKFIIDVRDNGGGNSVVGEKLLQAMGMEPPSYGEHRKRDLSKNQQQISGSEGLFSYSPDLSTAKINENIGLIVLTNRYTFSSATMLGVWVQDGKLGKIIGQPSSNAPTCFGDMLHVLLPESKTDLVVSYKKFLRPNPNANQDTLSPDILTERGEDALLVALEYLSAK